MNLLAMLELANRPWVVRKDLPRDPGDKPRASKPKPNRNKANEIRRAQAIERYKAVLGTEWVSMSDIAQRLGVRGTSVLGTLRRWERDGLVACRPLGGKRGNRSAGLEWRFL